MDTTSISFLSEESIEQCRSSPAAAFIREYSGQCRFTPNPDYAKTAPVKYETLITDNIIQTTNENYITS